MRSILFATLISLFISLTTVVAQSNLPANCYAYQCPLYDEDYDPTTMMPNPLDIASTTYNGAIAKCKYYSVEFMVDVATCRYNLRTGVLTRAAVGSSCPMMAMQSTISCMKKRELESSWDRQEAIARRERKSVDLEKRLSGKKAIKGIKQRAAEAKVEEVSEL